MLKLPDRREFIVWTAIVALVIVAGAAIGALIVTTVRSPITGALWAIAGGIWTRIALDFFLPADIVKTERLFAMHHG